MTADLPQEPQAPATAPEQAAAPAVTDAVPQPATAQVPQPVAAPLAQAAHEAGAVEEDADDMDADADEFAGEPGQAGGQAQPPRGPRPPRGAPRENRFADVVTGQFDADEEQADLPPPKRVLSPQAEQPKLHKVLAQAGMGSRLEMEQLIMEGRITVNNEPAHIGQRIQFGDHVKVNGKPVKVRIDAPPARVIAYHKPVGEVVTHDDPQNRPTVFRKLPKLFQGKWQSVGRLDLNTEGLLLFTSSGELANKLMHPRFGLEREYAVRVLGALTAEEKQRLLEGVKLDDGMGQFGSIEEGGGEGANCWYRVTISEGRNREVRRMLEAVGHAVSRLIRIRYGAMVLPRGLKRGAFVELDDGEIRGLVQAATPRGPREERAGGRAEGEGGERGERGDGQPPSKRNRSRGVRGRGGNNGPQRGNGPPQGGQQQPQGGGQGKPKNRNNEQRGNRGQGGGGGGGDNQPDPMKTAFGYIGADSFTKQRQGPGGPRRGGGGGGGFGGGGGGFGGGQRRGGGGRGR